MKRLVIAMALCGAGLAHAQQDPLEVASDQQVTAQAPGAVRTGPYFKGVEKKTDWMVQLETGKCYWFSGAAGVGVKKLALYLWGPDNKRRTDAKSPGPMATMAHCPTVPGMYKFQAKIDGSGPYNVGIYAKDAVAQAAPPPPPAPAAPPPPAVDLGAIIEKQAATAAPGAKRIGDFFDGAAGRMDHQEWAVALDPGKCYWFIGAGIPGDVKKLSLFLWGPNNKRITETKSSDSNAMVGHCTQSPGMHKLQAKIASGGGAFKVGVYAK